MTLTIKNYICLQSRKKGVNMECIKKEWSVDCCHSWGSKEQSSEIGIDWFVNRRRNEWSMSCNMRERKASATELNSVLLNFNLINALPTDYKSNRSTDSAGVQNCIEIGIWQLAMHLDLSRLPLDLDLHDSSLSQIASFTSFYVPTFSLKARKF